VPGHQVALPRTSPGRGRPQGLHDVADIDPVEPARHQGGQPAAPQREQDRAHARRGVVERADDAGRVHHHRVQPTVDDAPQLDLTRRLRTVVGRQLRPLGARGGLVHGPAGHGGQIEGVHGAAVHESGNAVLERRLGHNPYAVDVD
jgi:hypothetical protein